MFWKMRSPSFVADALRARLSSRPQRVEVVKKGSLLGDPFARR